MINLNSLIYGKIYFPIKSNRLKEIGNFIGTSWAFPDASGIQSLVWRHHWEKTQDEKYFQHLITYNQEDCQALGRLVDFLSQIKNNSDSLMDVDFADNPKRHQTEIGYQLHHQFETILKSAHANYNRSKISFRKAFENSDEKEKNRNNRVGHPGYWKKKPEADRVVRLPRLKVCPKHQNELLEPSNKMAEHVIIDLEFFGNGVKKLAIKYIGKKARCSKCKKYYPPQKIIELSGYYYGHSLKAWFVYQRLSLHAPYRNILQVAKDQFNETISVRSPLIFQKYFVDYYSEIEEIHLQRILTNNFVHVDETKINVKGIDNWVWVFTDGKHVVFRLTETREANIVHNVLSDYEGVLVSDFYGGYDSIDCEQQKCWSHLIRDINDDLWKAPFDIEFENFVIELRNFIVPIFLTIEKYGLRKWNLNKFRKNIERFYAKIIEGKTYKTEYTLKYQKRFIRYRNSLFTFLEHDGIPWNNNMAERALRHLAVQRKISGSFRGAEKEYLLLLGITQTCRFQDKSLLKFLLSGKKDIDKFRL